MAPCLLPSARGGDPRSAWSCSRSSPLASSALLSGRSLADTASILQHPRVLEVIAALRAVELQEAAENITVLGDSAPTAAAAAEQLGCELGAIANSLIFSVHGQPLLILTSGAHRVNTAFVAEFLGVATLDRADADFVRIHTGQAIGGVGPVGHPHPIGTLVDIDLMNHDVIWAAAGHPHTMFPTTFADLVRMTDGTVTQVEP